MGRHEISDVPVIIRDADESSHGIRRRWDLLAIFTVLLIVAWLGILSALVLRATNQIAEASEKQIAAVSAQNDIQICVQHDILSAVKGIGRKLGLPVDDIHPPDVERLDCEAFSSGS